MATWDEPTTLARLWADSVERHPQESFLVFEGPDGRVSEWTYAAFDRQVERVAAFLDDHGATAGSAVHLALTNCPTFIAVWIAATRLGAWIIPSDPMGRTPELADHIERTAPVIGFYSVDRADEYLAAATAEMMSVAIDETDASLAAFPEARFTEDDRKGWPAPALLDRAAVMFTSGTTGQPKGVVITQANYAFAGQTMAKAAALTSDDRQLVVLPLFHANAQYYSFASAISVGASVALMHTFSASGFLRQAAKHGATCASLFAAPLRMILARGGPVDGLALRHCWFAQNIADDQYETISEWFGCRPRQLYGMTETIPAVLTDTVAKPRADSMGFVTPDCDVQVHDGDGDATPSVMLARSWCEVNGA